MYYIFCCKKLFVKSSSIFPKIKVSRYMTKIIHIDNPLRIVFYLG